LPKIDGRSVEELVFDPLYEPCPPGFFDVRQDDMWELCDWIVDGFPHVRRIVFENACLATPGWGALLRETMAERGTVVFDLDLVVETDDPN
jgi:hypothetical protein